jgi:hypothetical protein
MCMGEFSVVDPRCCNWSNRAMGMPCYWCGIDLSPNNWASKEASLLHDKSCPMRTLWSDTYAVEVS